MFQYKGVNCSLLSRTCEYPVQSLCVRPTKKRCPNMIFRDCVADVVCQCTCKCDSFDPYESEYMAQFTMKQTPPCVMYSPAKICRGILDFPSKKRSALNCACCKCCTKHQQVNTSEVVIKQRHGKSPSRTLDFSRQLPISNSSTPAEVGDPVASISFGEANQVASTNQKDPTSNSEETNPYLADTTYSALNNSVDAGGGLISRQSSGACKSDASRKFEDIWKKIDGLDYRNHPPYLKITSQLTQQQKANKQKSSHRDFWARIDKVPKELKHSVAVGKDHHTKHRKTHECSAVRNARKEVAKDSVLRDPNSVCVGCKALAGYKPPQVLRNAKRKTKVCTAPPPGGKSCAIRTVPASLAKRGVLTQKTPCTKDQDKTMRTIVAPNKKPGSPKGPCTEFSDVIVHRPKAGACTKESEEEMEPETKSEAKTEPELKPETSIQMRISGDDPLQKNSVNKDKEVIGGTSTKADGINVDIGSSSCSFSPSSSSSPSTSSNQQKQQEEEKQKSTKKEDKQKSKNIDTSSPTRKKETKQQNQQQNQQKQNNQQQGNNAKIEENVACIGTSDLQDYITSCRSLDLSAAAAAAELEKQRSLSEQQLRKEWQQEFPRQLLRQLQKLQQQQTSVQSTPCFASAGGSDSRTEISATNLSLNSEDFQMSHNYYNSPETPTPIGKTRVRISDRIFEVCLRCRTIPCTCPRIAKRSLHCLCRLKECVCKKRSRVLLGREQTMPCCVCGSFPCCCLETVGTSKSAFDRYNVLLRAGAGKSADDYTAVSGLYDDAVTQQKQQPPAAQFTRSAPARGRMTAGRIAERTLRQDFYRPFLREQNYGAQYREQKPTQNAVENLEDNHQAQNLVHEKNQEYIEVQDTAQNREQKPCANCRRAVCVCTQERKTCSECFQLTCVCGRPAICTKCLGTKCRCFKLKRRRSGAGSNSVLDISNHQEPACSYCQKQECECEYIAFCPAVSKKPNIPMKTTPGNNINNESYNSLTDDQNVRCSFCLQSFCDCKENAKSRNSIAHTSSSSKSNFESDFSEIIVPNKIPIASCELCLQSPCTCGCGGMNTFEQIIPMTVQKKSRRKKNNSLRKESPVSKIKQKCSICKNPEACICTTGFTKDSKEFSEVNVCKIMTNSSSDEEIISNRTQIVYYDNFPSGKDDSVPKSETRKRIEKILEKAKSKSQVTVITKADQQICDGCLNLAKKTGDIGTRKDEKIIEVHSRNKIVKTPGKSDQKPDMSMTEFVPSTNVICSYSTTSGCNVNKETIDLNLDKTQEINTEKIITKNNIKNRSSDAVARKICSNSRPTDIRNTMVPKQQNRNASLDKFGKNRKLCKICLKYSCICKNDLKNCDKRRSISHNFDRGSSNIIKGGSLDSKTSKLIKDNTNDLSNSNMKIKAICSRCKKPNCECGNKKRFDRFKNKAIGNRSSGSESSCEYINTMKFTTKLREKCSVVENVRNLGKDSEQAKKNSAVKVRKSFVDKQEGNIGNKKLKITTTANKNSTKIIDKRKSLGGNKMAKKTSAGPRNIQNNATIEKATNIDNPESEIDVENSLNKIFSVINEKRKSNPFIRDGFIKPKRNSESDNNQTKKKEMCTEPTKLKAQVKNRKPAVFPVKQPIACGVCKQLICTCRNLGKNIQKKCKICHKIYPCKCLVKEPVKVCEMESDACMKVADAVNDGSLNELSPASQILEEILSFSTSSRMTPTSAQSSSAVSTDSEEETTVSSSTSDSTACNLSQNSEKSTCSIEQQKSSSTNALLDFNQRIVCSVCKRMPCGCIDEEDTDETIEGEIEYEINEDEGTRRDAGCVTLEDSGPEQVQRSQMRWEISASVEKEIRTVNFETESEHYAIGLTKSTAQNFKSPNLNSTVTSCQKMDLRAAISHTEEKIRDPNEENEKNKYGKTWLRKRSSSAKK